ncbi:MAG: hypothetical protein IKW76_10315 [Clostridia bacterium]|nr:hypothetical protein [Clostridia bacterium]
MKRNVSKLLAIVMTLALVMSFAAVSAAAVDYTATNGGSTSFEKNLVVDSTAQIPNVEFEFTIEAGTPVPGGADNALEIKAGPVTASAPTIESAQFTSGMTTTAGTPEDETDTTKKFAVDDVVIDLTGVTFTAPGVYRYVITETATTLSGVTNDANAVRYLDLFVFPSEEDPTELEVTTYSLRDTATSFERVPDADHPGQYKYQYVTNPTVKTSGYTNELETVDLEFTKAITGNQADKNKQFKFTLALTDVNPGLYTVEVSRADVVKEDSNVTANEGVYTIEVPANSTSATAYFYLADGDTVAVKDLPVGYGYTVTEDAEDYESTAANVPNYTDPYTDTDVEDDAATSYTNDRTGIIPTGVIIMIAPFAIGLFVFGAIILYMVSKRRRVAY